MFPAHSFFLKDKKLFSDIFYSLSRNILNILCQLLLSIAIARGLGVSGNGNYGLAITYITLFSSIFSLGINTSIIYYGAGNIKSLSVLMSNGLVLVILLVFLGFFLGIATTFFSGSLIFPSLNSTILILCVFSACFVLLNQYMLSFLQAKQDFKSFNALLILQSFLQLIFQSIAVFINADPKVSLLFVLCAYLFSQTISLVVTTFICFRKKNISFHKGHLNFRVINNLVLYGVKNFFSDIITIVNNRIDVYLLGLLLSPCDVGIYFLATQITEKLWVLSHSVSTVIFPKMSAVYSDKNINNGKVIINKVMWITFIITLFFALLLAVVGYYFIMLLYGISYAKAYDIILVMLPGICAMSVSRIISNDIAAKGYPEYNFYCSVFIVIMNIILNVAFIPKYGVYGAASVTSFVYCLSFFVRLLISRLTSIRMGCYQ